MVDSGWSLCQRGHGVKEGGPHEKKKVGFLDVLKGNKRLNLKIFYINLFHKFF